MNLIDEETRCELRAPEAVLCGSDMNGAWGTRHSFARTMLRRAASHQWRVTKSRLELDELGRGTAVYTIDAEGYSLKFIAFCQALEESERTDRVIANAWDVTAALIEGVLSPEREAELRRNVTVQEQGRTDPETFIMTRANRSARFFDYVSDCLAAGTQPDVAKIGPSPYLIRSTAFYGNGKFGLKELATLPAAHPLSVPYRSQMLAAWLLRELSMDLVEHVARAKARAAGTNAVPLNAQWGKYFGLGNATGLGMVPFLVNHPGYLDAWCKLREIPLAVGLATRYAPEDPDLGRVVELLERADRHLAEKSELKTAPFLSTDSIRPQLRQLLGELQAFRASGGKAVPVLARLHELAADLSPEARGLFASIVIELRNDFDRDAEAILTVGAPPPFDPAMRGVNCGHCWNRTIAGPAPSTLPPQSAPPTTGTPPRTAKNRGGRNGHRWPTARWSTARTWYAGSTPWLPIWNASPPDPVWLNSCWLIRATVLLPNGSSKPRITAMGICRTTSWMHNSCR
ncbi:hypothetical protein IV498_07395 [Paenarthrobacter sp. Z7-10]|uniref:hypothetical protein n=1 Tax=Paenarthrobacter sp. Z7-10 TaxID=2787635 RepID=UPI0022A9D4AC|nr:hypothetical protein [Paenarthrobacter sp. Z7-10]MCZ2403012.1 hypothetical protein [Paenarthrobacter sp. Z7-10]